MPEIQQPKEFQRESYEQILADYLPENEEVRALILSFFNSFPELPRDPRAAFVAIQNYLIENSFQYDNRTFMLEDMIREKKGNCLGLGVMFGTILKQQGFEPKYEVAVSPQDAHYRNDLKQFGRLVHGEVFAYDDLPDLPNEKAEMPQGWFTPLEHPILIVGGQNYETTSLLISEDSSIEHGYKSESRRPVNHKNLLGALFTSKAKVILGEPGSDYGEIVNLTRRGLGLWPEDRQSWLLLRGLAIHHFDDKSAAEAESKFRSINGDDSLYNFSLYELTGDEKLLDRSLQQYPAYVEAFVRKNIKLPIKDKREAKFNFTVAAVCVANSTEIDLDSFYLRNIEIIAQAVGEDYAADLLYDLEIDNKWPAKYYLSMYHINKYPQFLIRAAQNGLLEESTPLELLHICDTIVKETASDNSSATLEVRNRCAAELEKLRATYGNSDLFKSELAKTSSQ